MSDMVSVTKEQFYAAMKIDVHPRAEKEASYWETPSRQLIGISTPGYMCEGEKSFRLDPRYIAK